MNALTNSINTNELSRFMEDLTLVRIPPWWQSPWFIAGVLLLLALGWIFGRRIYIRWKAGQTSAKPAASAPAEPAHLLALRELEELRRKKDELGAYRLAIACSKVLRRYIEAQFDLPILYQTTREFLHHARSHSSFSQEQRSTLGAYLNLCDMIKFARRGASGDECTHLVDAAVTFIQACAHEKPSTANSSTESST